MAASPFKTAITAGLDTIRQVTGEPVTISRVGEDDISIAKATLTRATRDQLDALGFPVDLDMMQFIFALDELAAWELPLPQAEDEIEVDDTGDVWKVIEPPGAAAWAAVDAYGHNGRVYARKV